MNGYFYDSVLESAKFFEEEEEQEKQELLFEEVFEEEIKDMVNKLAPRLAEAYSPLQLLSKANEGLSKSSDLFGEVISLRGVFKSGNGIKYQNGYYYDRILDENSSVTINILITENIRKQLKLDSLVVLKGMMNKRLDGNKGEILLYFRVDSLIEELKSNAINDDDLKRLSLIKKKNEQGRKPVKSLLKTILMRNERPQVCLLYAQTSITDQDFDKGVKSASSQIDFYIEKSVSFSNTLALTKKLKELDYSKKYNAICLVRGGGSGMDKLDDVQLLECLVSLSTPIVAGLGHVGEEYSIKSVVDENIGTPSLLGQYFDNLVKETAQEREGTINNLAQKIEARYKPQLERLAKLEKDSKSDKDQINKLLEEKKSDVEKYSRINQELVDLKRNFDSKIIAANKQVIAQLYIWIFISLVCIIISAIILYLYGQQQLWW